MSDACFRKCVNRYKDADLSVGEMSCTDRCVGKYLQSLEKVAERVQRVEEQVKQQAEAAEAMGKRMGGGS